MSYIQSALSKELAQAKQNISRVKKLQQESTLLKSTYQKLHLQIQMYHPRYAALLGISKPLDVDNLKKILAHNEILIEFLVTDDRIIAFIIGRKIFKIHEINISRKDLKYDIHRLLKPFVDFKKGYTDFSRIHFDVRLSNRLYKSIFVPIEDALSSLQKNVKKRLQLILVPDDVLFYLPFEALVTRINKRKIDSQVLFSEYENATYLIEKYLIIYAPSASVLDPKLKKVRHSSRKTLLAFANPEIDKKSRDMIGFEQPGSRIFSFKPLPKSETEVENISTLFGRENCTIFTGKAARESVFKKECGKYMFLHLATHANVSAIQPLYSSLLFSTADPKGEDGFLHTHEIYNLDLNCDLVTLSACETGLGELREGEGIIGLTRAFMYAGSPCIVASLWSMEESTSPIMSLFYQNLNTGVPPGTALRRAKLHLMRRRGKIAAIHPFSFSHPYLWAAFIVIGR